MSNELIDEYIIKKQKMQQQVLQSIGCREQSDNPQFTEGINDKKSKQHSKKKKQFKIKKSNLSKEKKGRKQQGFSNPIYAGFDDKDSDNENKMNFGPWIHQVTNSTVGFNQSHEFSPQCKQTIYRQSKSQFTRYQKQDNNIINQTQQINESKGSRKSMQQIRCSSVMIEMMKTKTNNIALSPLKQPLRGGMQESQQSRNLNKNRSSSSSIQLLKYHSLKYLFQDREKPAMIGGGSSNMSTARSPNAVIYNYCCSSIDNNLFGSDLGNMLLNSQSRNKISTLNDSKQLSKDKSTPRKSNEKLTPISIMKNINRELYDELIKRKSRVK